jgi:site-specific DNA-methyltransferase (adenine-specific)
VIAEPLRPLARPIGEFRLLDGNPRRGDVASVKRSLQRFGQRKPIVVRADGTVEAGNTTLKAALELGWDQIAAVAFDDDEAVAKAFALADNRTSELGAFDLAALTAMAVEVHAVDPGLLEAASFTEADLNALLAGQKVPPKLNDPDDAPEPPGVPVTVPGDLWLLGPHRLLCGDAQTPEALDRVLDGSVDAVLTDPPYGMNLDTDYTIRPWGSDRGLLKDRPAKTYRPVIGDDEPFDAGFLINYFGSVKEQFWFGADYYRRTLSEQDIDGSWLVWDKRGEGADNGIGSGFELIWSRQKHKRDLLRHFWYGAFGAEASGRVHPTQKPAKLLADIMERWVKPQGVIADPFGGSGSTLIAAHGTNRTVRLVELDPAYCDVICRRFQEHTGCKPVLEATGVPHDFTA